MSITSKKIILPACTLEKKQAKNLKAADAFLFANDQKKEIPPVELFSLENVNVNASGIVFNRFHVFKQFLIWPQHQNVFNGFYLLRNYIKRKKRNTDPETNYLLCFDYWSGGYFHWVCDFLPRLFLMKEELKHLVLLLPENLSAPYVEATLKAFQVEHIFRFKANEYVLCNRLLVPGYATESGENNPELMRKIATQLRQFYPLPTSAAAYAENVYVSRSNAKFRFVQNEKEVVALLQKYNFRVIRFEEHTFEEQVNIAYFAKNLVGLHGANLTNCIFMSEETNLLELRREDDSSNNYYYSLASSLNLNYYYQRCRATNIKSLQTFDLLVDLEELEKNIRLMLKLS